MMLAALKQLLVLALVPFVMLILLNARHPILATAIQLGLAAIILLR